MRMDGWEKRLAEYIEVKRRLPFAWGSNDCISFANGAYAAMTGSGFCDDWCGKTKTGLTTRKFFKRLLAEGPFLNSLEMVDSRLDRGAGFSPPRGSIIARPDTGLVGNVFGVVISHKAAFVGHNGLEFITVSRADNWWGV